MSFGFEANDFFASFSAATPPDGCTQCGICLNSCPTYAKSEDHGQSPMGRIRLMRELESDGIEGIAPDRLEKLESCLGCYTCELVCPSKVNFGKMLDESLALIRAQRPLPRMTRMMQWLACRVSVLKAIVVATYLAQILGLRPLLSKLGLLKQMGLQRADALLGKVGFPTRLRNRVHQCRSDRRVALFTGCFSSVMEQELQQAAIRVFNALGLEVMLPKEQGCCGALHRHNGDLETAAMLARMNIKAFSAEKADAIVATSSGCGASLKDYGAWLVGEELTAPVMDVSDYLSKALDNALKQHKLEFNALPMKVALHTPCTLRHGEGQEEAVFALLQHIPGLEIVPLSGEPRCCGAGGSHVLSHPGMADALRDDMINEIQATGADVLLSSNLGCAMHLREGLKQAGIHIPLQHPVQLIAQAMAV